MTPPRAMRLAALLWIALAVIVWNVVFDHVIVVAGRAYIHAAGVAAGGAGPYPRMDDWMHPAAVRGVWVATRSALAVLALFFAGLAGARVRARAR